MTIPSWSSREVFVKDEENFKRRRALMPAFAARTKRVINDERARVNLPNRVSSRRGNDREKKRE